ncbi:MAG: hypothetical protein RIC19_18195 [Phaeodactylibacter sp.]|uniref:hypothetical protein n=1 Tax=Phaeodactylibacter sp. TaxID=1940289 RepID=UPI0032EC7920
MKQQQSMLAETRRLAIAGDLAAAYTALDKTAVPAHLRAHRDTLAHNFFVNERSWKAGALAAEDYEVQRARSANALFDLINQLEETPINRRKPEWYIWGALGLLMLLLAVWFFSQKPDQSSGEPNINATTHGNQSPVVIGDSATLNYQNTTAKDTLSE